MGPGHPECPERLDAIEDRLLISGVGHALTRIEAEGQPFDPQLHEAVTHEDSDDHASGHVIEVLRQGYKLGDRVIRPALVRVAK